MPRRIAILIGNSKFSEPDVLPPLAGPRNDVEYLARVLGDRDRGRFEVIRCIDEEHYTILSNIERNLQSTTKEDFVIIFYSGHGRRNATGQLCLAAANTRSEVLNSTSVFFPNLRQLAEEARCENILLLLDCCFSGAVSSSFGMRGSVAIQLQDLAQETAGLHILTSSASYQVSTEREHDHSGIVLGDFTACIVEGLKSGAADDDRDGEIRLSELRRYVQTRLRGQTAQYWGFRVFGDPVISYNPEIKLGDRRQLARRRLADWNRKQAIPSSVFFASVDFLSQTKEEEDDEDVEHVVDLLLNADCQPSHFLTHWEYLRSTALGSENASTPSVGASSFAAVNESPWVKETPEVPQLVGTQGATASASENANTGSVGASSVVRVHDRPGGTPTPEVPQSVSTQVITHQRGRMGRITEIGIYLLGVIGIPFGIAITLLNKGSKPTEIDSGSSTPTAATAGASMTPDAGGQVHEVRMVTTQGGASGQFEPAQIMVKEGDVIRWTMADGEAVHNVSFTQGQNNPAGFTPPADSPMYTQQGQTYELKVDWNAGTYNYVCVPHSMMGMTGSVTVQ